MTDSEWKERVVKSLTKIETEVVFIKDWIKSHEKEDDDRFKAIEGRKYEWVKGVIMMLLGAAVTGAITYLMSLS